MLEGGGLLTHLDNKHSWVGIGGERRLVGEREKEGSQSALGEIYMRDRSEDQ